MNLYFEKELLYVVCKWSSIFSKPLWRSLDKAQSEQLKPKFEITQEKTVNYLPSIITYIHIVPAFSVLFFVQKADG